MRALPLGLVLALDRAALSRKVANAIIAQSRRYLSAQMIPFRETRNYVRAIMRRFVHFQKLRRLSPKSWS